MSLLYALYAFVIAGIDISAGMRLVKREGWEQWVGFSALIVGAVALVAGFQALLGFAVDPLWLLLPLVGAGFVIMVDSWKRVKEKGGLWSIVIAVYNTFAWIVNLIQLLALLQRRRE